MSDFLTQLPALFEQFEAKLEGMVQGPLHARRQAALARLLANGLPTQRAEAYKYTPINQAFTDDLVMEEFAKGLPHNKLPFMRNPLVQQLKGNVLCTYNGRFEPQISTILSPIYEMEMLSTYSGERMNSRTLERWMGQVQGEDNALADLNLAFSNHGLQVRVFEGKQVELPLVIYHLAESALHRPLVQPRVLIVLGAGAKLNVTEVFQSTGELGSVINSVMEVVLEEGAELEVTKVQAVAETDTLVDHTFCQQAARSRSRFNMLSMRGKTVRNNLTISLNDKEAHADLFGLYHPRNGAHIDNQTFVRHMAPNCTSEELYKGIVEGKSTAVFNGKIYVAEDAQKTNAFQSNRNILLDAESTVNTKPQLEIFADDVRCTHGATIGQLSEDALFYLRARGIGERDAKMLLLEAFAGEVLDKITLANVRALAESLMENGKWKMEN